MRQIGTGDTRRTREAQPTARRDRTAPPQRHLGVAAGHHAVRDPESECNQTAFVFTPIPGQAAIVLPRGFGVYGLALSASNALPCQNRARNPSE